MKVTNEKTEKRQAFLTVEMEPVEVEGFLEKSYHRLVKKVNIPGFRRGKAPRAILERYIGKESLLEDALDHLVPEACEKAITEQKIEAVAQPQVEITQTEPVVFKVVVPLPPEIKLGDYHHIKATPEPVEVTEENVNRAMEQLRHQHAIWEPVERPVEFGDLVILDIESSIGDKPFVNQAGVQYQVIKESSFPAPGFAGQIAGMKRDESKEFKLNLASYYPKSELAGKEASFKVKVLEIKHEKLPELNDEFAKVVDPECKSLDSLRERVSADVRWRAEGKVRADFEEKVIKAVVNITELEFPPILVEREIERLLNQRLQYWQMDNRGLEEYLKSINKTEDELREELRPLATKRVTQALVLGKVTEEEKIEVSDAEIDADIERILKAVAEKKDELQKSLNTAYSRESIRQSLITQKTVQQLVEIARGSNLVAETIQKEGEND